MDRNIAASRSSDNFKFRLIHPSELQSSTLPYFLLFLGVRCESPHQLPCKLDAKPTSRTFASAADKRRYLSDIRRAAANCRWHPKPLGDANIDANDFACSHARSRSIKEMEVEVEVEMEATPQSSSATDPGELGQTPQALCRENRFHGHRRGKKRRIWKDRDVLRAEGADRYWGERVGGLYRLVKAAFLAAHPNQQTYFWSRLDALWLGQFLERRPNATLEDIRGLLINYHASDGVNRHASAEKVFSVLQDYAVMNPAKTNPARTHQVDSWDRKTARIQQEARVGRYDGPDSDLDPQVIGELNRKHREAERERQAEQERQQRKTRQQGIMQFWTTASDLMIQIGCNEEEFFKRFPSYAHFKGTRSMGGNA